MWTTNSVFTAILQGCKSLVQSATILQGCYNLKISIWDANMVYGKTFKGETFMVFSLTTKVFKAGVRWPHAWFLEIDVVCEVCMCMCVSVYPPPRLLITSGMIGTPYDWLNKFTAFICDWI